MRLTEEDMQQRREKIIRNAFLLFSERGIEGVKLSEIAKKSHVSENTIYRYFGNKESLVQEAFIELWEHIMTSVEKNVENTMNYSELSGFEQICVWIDGFKQLYREDKEFVLFSYEAKLYLLRHHIKIDQSQQDLLMHNIHDPCMAALDKGKQDGSIPVKEDSEDLFFAIWGAIRGYIVKIVIYGELYGEDSPWESRYEVVKQGILSALRSGWQ